MREGAGDPLAGAALDARAAGGMWRAGRLAPRWGRGLVLGSAGSPWSRAALDRGDGAPYRGRAGDGLRYRRAGPIDLEALAGRFARRDLACLRVGTAGAGVGLLGARGGDLEWSVGLERPGGDGEIDVLEVVDANAPGKDGFSHGIRWRSGGLQPRKHNRE